eukprot:1193399-Prorocentrum_minimum.AAC.2
MQRAKILGCRGAGGYGGCDGDSLVGVPPGPPHTSVFFPFLPDSRAPVGPLRALPHPPDGAIEGEKTPLDERHKCNPPRAPAPGRATQM